jgi:phosphatidylinositol alpha-1,6-mannosyltransferase
MFLLLTPRIDGKDGISELSRQVANGLSRAGGSANVDTWALDGGPPHDAGSSRRFWSANGGRLRIVRRAMTRAVRPCAGLDVIVMHIHLAPLARLLGRRGARVTTFLVGIESWSALRSRERRAFEDADRVVAISQFTARRFRDANPDLASRSIAICSPGIGPAPRARDTHVPEGFALIVGRLSSAERYKGHDAIIDAWPAVRAAVPDARLLVVGDGDDRARLETAVSSRGLGEAISFTGQVDDEELAALYARSAFFVMPSPGEGFGLVYLEAMRAGKPCIAVHGSADEIVRHGVDGLVIEPDSRADLVSAIVRLFSDQDQRLRMGLAARERVQESFAADCFDVRLADAIGLSPKRPHPQRRGRTLSEGVAPSAKEYS